MPERTSESSRSPENRETPLGDLQSWVTPNRLFFVRNHFEAPVVEASAWRLVIGGRVNREITLTLDELQTLPQRSVFSTIECAGNGRSFLQQKVEGVQWGAGAIGHAEWSGVPLRDVLDAAGLHSGVVEIVAIGADSGYESGHDGPITFARSLPLDKARHPDTLLALRMNGEPLEPSHGFPVRLLVPGWFGVASVKWLTRIEAASTPFEGHFQSIKYVMKRRTGRGIEKEMVGAMPVKSEIIRPRPGEVLGAGRNRIFGLAWAGEEAVTALEVSTDGGMSWSRASLMEPRASYSWTLWEYAWNVRRSGDYALLARAISESGQVQPSGYDPLRAGYLINFSRPIAVRVDASRRSNELPGYGRSLAEEMSEFAAESARLPLDVELEFIHGAGI